MERPRCNHMARAICLWHGWFAFLLVTVCGCGNPLVFNDVVEGTAKLDGKPLGNAHVQFVPDEPGVKAPGSTGITDENGHYRLHREDGGGPGACVGKHVVVLVRGREANRALGETADAGDAKAKKDRRPIPPAYTMASKTPLTVDVKSDQHTYDLELSSHR
jgi:hypothetical protein